MGLAFSARLCQIPRVLMHQTKRLVLPPRITDENRDTERWSILPQLTQMLGAGLRTGPLWSNLKSRCLDDPEGVAETRRPMLSQVRACTHNVHVAFTFVATGVRENQRDTRRGQTRAKVYKEEKLHFPGSRGIPFYGESDSTLHSSPWTQDLTVQ